MIEIKNKIVNVKLIEQNNNVSKEVNNESFNNTPVVREDIVRGFTIRIKYNDASYYFVLNFNSNKELVELFVNSSTTSPETNAFIQTVARLVSNLLKYRVPIDKIIKHLDGVDSGQAYICRFPGKDKGKFVKSIPDLIAKVLTYYSDYDFVQSLVSNNNFEQEQNNVSDVKEDKKETNKKKNSFTCPSCGGNNVKIEEGCLTCLDCGWSKCG